MLRIALEIQSGLRGYYFGQTEIADTREILRTLWSSVDSKIAGEWVRRTFGILQREEVLFCGLCEQGTCRAEAKFAAVYGEKWTTACKAYDTGCPMRYLRENWANMGTSQGRESFEQFARKLGKAVHELSCKTAPAEAFLYYLRETSESEGFMSASLLGIPICGTARKGIAGDAQRGIRGTGEVICPHDGVSNTLTRRMDGSPCLDRGPQVVVQLYENHGQDSRNFLKKQTEFYPKPANTLLSKANLSYRYDQDNLVVAAVDCRNMRETEQFGTLQSKENGGQSSNDGVTLAVNSIDVLSDTCYNTGNRQTEVLDYVKTSENNTKQVLFVVWREIGEKAFQEWEARIVAALRKEKVLQQDVYGSGFRCEGICIGRMDDLPLSCPKTCPGRMLRDLWQPERDRCSPQGRELRKQLSREFAAYMQGLSSQATPNETLLHDMRKARKRVGVLRQTLPEVQKIRRPVDGEAKPTHTNYSVRRLTPLEAERLQGYPDGWKDIPGASDSARYRALGNSFAIPNAYFVISRCVAVMEGINT